MLLSVMDRELRKIITSCLHGDGDSTSAAPTGMKFRTVFMLEYLMPLH